MTLLALPLTNFEEYMLADDYPGHPLTIAARLRFSGQVSQQAATAACQRVFERHPLVHSRVSSKGRKKVWTSALNAVEPPLFVAGEPTRELPDLERFDLFEENGGKFTFVQGEQLCEMFVRGHHACLDGIGALQLIQDWMQCYHEEEGSSSHTVKLRRLDPELLHQRGDFGFRTWQYVKQLPRQALGLYGIHEFLNHRAVPLVPSRPARAEFPAKGIHAVESIDWTPTQFERHLRYANQLGIQTNELLVAALFKSMSHWRHARSLGSEEDWLRVMVPFNMREFKHRKMPAANRVSFVSVDRRARPFHQFDKLAQGIHGQMEVIHSHNLGLTFQAFLNLRAKMPGGVARLARPDLCGATAILTNLGRPFRRSRLPEKGGKICPGNLVLQDYELMPPLRPNTHVSFAAFRYAGKQRLTACYDQRELTREDVRELLDELAREAIPVPD